MAEIVVLNEQNTEWSQYEADEAIRFKALTQRDDHVPPVQYIEYAPGHTDPVHQHRVGEFFVVTEGEIWIDDKCTPAGAMVFIPANTDYAVRAGDQGARYYRIVTG